ncbi:adenosine deaminase, putative [Entamoeba histolytica HM-1:IMSS-B]|uniref:adenosine deaminase n=5 Tax=Entamoeba histolytica TaxID=5759 RepID=C4LXR8_ENTH1|nr:adenosine deaminase, putative [Entamoeba histolytica HM-1:IMSS]EMD46910.1 adenosine deaminase, putative [Entamoeba histolytica KU27]EMH75011.1 adenosine deaminase, putative [Entamoeba histolytica HM-1:IMSS-B]ENY62453.1 adenosine deaminase, putative [Entamoeba histolytica HM-1:IMSS-A]GAT93562.1 adenosine deaminase putative [Entamoeba histolytica]EAL49696.1 adenosine deaminase, putative [Entamoeba histolytica HM-1:IMSS]|eukprot:XP_655082.1 adenosine deaminase, putative [Entamoeba histolytica HM-1:IMSS]
MTTTITHDLFKQMPKADLHRHYDGCIRPSSIIEIAKEQNIELPTYDLNELNKLVMMTNDCESLVQYLKAFDIINLVLQTKDNIERTMFECCEDAYLDGCTYVEFRFAPIQSTNKGLSMKEVMEACIAGVKKAEKKYGIVVRLIVCAMRHLSEEESLKAAQLAVEFKNDHVVGFDLAGPENGFMPSRHKKACQYAFDHGIHITIHAGEAAGYESVDDAIKNHAERIGHGVRLLENKETIKNVIENKVIVECCLTSNIQTKAINKMEDHPILQLMELGIPCTINTDNTTVSSCSLSGEDELFTNLFGFSNEQIVELIMNSFRAAFIEDESIRTKLIQDAYTKMRQLKVIV